MSVERMRRVDEAVREVLSDVLTHEVKDPRVGFVTVTDVKTSPDLRHARVYVSVLGDAEAVERLAGGTAVRPRLPAGARRQRAAPQAHADADLLPRRHGRAGAAPGAAAWTSRREHGRGRHPRGGPRRAARRDALRARHAREPRRRRARLAGGDAPHPARAGQGLGHVHGRRRVPAALRVPLLRARRPAEHAARRPRRAHDRLPRLRQHRPQPGGRLQARGGAHPQHRPPPRQHALRHGQPRGRGRVLHGRDRLGPDARAGRRARAWRSPRRSTSGSSPTPASSCTRTPACART